MLFDATLKATRAFLRRQPGGLHYFTDLPYPDHSVTVRRIDGRSWTATLEGPNGHVLCVETAPTMRHAVVRVIWRNWRRQYEPLTRP